MGWGINCLARAGRIGQATEPAGPACPSYRLRLASAISALARAQKRGLRGAVAQLGERLNGIQEVDGSIPFSSTKRTRVVRRLVQLLRGVRAGCQLPLVPDTSLPIPSNPGKLLAMC